MTTMVTDRAGALQTTHIGLFIREEFNGSAMPANFTSSTGTGGSVSVASGYASIVCGTSVSDTQTYTCNSTFTLPARVQFDIAVTVRDAYRSIYLDVVSEDGIDMASFLLDGSTATTVKSVTQNTSIATTQSMTWSDTSGSALSYEMIMDHDSVKFAQINNNASGAKYNTVNQSTDLPSPQKRYKARIRVVHAATAPAACTIQWKKLLIVEGANTPVEFTNKGRTNDSVSLIPVSLPLGVSPSVSTMWTESTTAQAAAASVAGTGRDAGSSTTQYMSFVAHAASDQTGTLYIQGSDDNTTFYTLTSATLTAASSITLEQTVVGWRYWRAYFTNGATLQTRFKLATRFKLM